ncbi:unnamed protein product [Natator depressus]
MVLAVTKAGQELAALTLGDQHNFKKELDYFLPSYHSLGQDRGRCWQDGQMDGKLPHSPEHAVHVSLDPEGLAWHILEPKEWLTSGCCLSTFLTSQPYLKKKQRSRKKVGREGSRPMCW